MSCATSLLLKFSNNSFRKTYKFTHKMESTEYAKTWFIAFVRFSVLFCFFFLFIFGSCFPLRMLLLLCGYLLRTRGVKMCVISILQRGIRSTKYMNVVIKVKLGNSFPRIDFFVIRSVAAYLRCKPFSLILYYNPPQLMPKKRKERKGKKRNERNNKWKCRKMGCRAFRSKVENMFRIYIFLPLIFRVIVNSYR